MFDLIPAYQGLIHILYQAGVASIQQRNRAVEVESLVQTLTRFSSEPIALGEVLRGMDWYECRSYVNRLLQSVGSRDFQKTLDWTTCAVQKMGEYRDYFFSMSLEGLLVRFHEGLLEFSTDLAEQRQVIKKKNKLQLRPLAEVYQKLGVDRPAIAWANLLRFVRNDIVHNFGVARRANLAAASNVRFSEQPGPTIADNQPIVMRPDHAYEIMREALHGFKSAAGIRDEHVGAPQDDTRPHTTVTWT